jgi:hypothetical protein
MITWTVVGSVHTVTGKFIGTRMGARGKPTAWTKVAVVAVQVAVTCALDGMAAPNTVTLAIATPNMGAKIRNRIRLTSGHFSPLLVPLLILGPERNDPVPEGQAGATAHSAPNP